MVTVESASASRSRFARVTALALLSLSAVRPAEAQEWRARVTSRLQVIRVRPLTFDSVPRADVTLVDGVNRGPDGARVQCTIASAFCFLYRPEGPQSTAPWTTDVEATAWGFGVQGLRVHVNARIRTALTQESLWPRANDHFDLIAAYLELSRSRLRLRAGRQFTSSGLGFYGYDGVSAAVTVPEWRLTLDGYAGWGLARGVPEPVNSDLFDFLGEFRPDDRTYLFGAGAAIRPARGTRVSVLYQREIETDRSGLASERAAFDASYSLGAFWLRANADYDVAVGTWGRASLLAGARVAGPFYAEAQVFRYRPTFSLQTIWAAFSPISYAGFAVRGRATLDRGIWISAGVERRQYAETHAEVPLADLTDRAWTFSVDGGWSPASRVSLAGRYGRTYGAGAALSHGDARVAVRPMPEVEVALSGSAFQQLYEFRIGEARVYAMGAEVSARLRPGREVWGSLHRYHHNRRGDHAAGVDWNQWRGDLGFSVYLGREPGWGGAPR